MTACSICGTWWNSSVTCSCWLQTPSCAGNAYPSRASGFIPFLSGVPSCAGNAYPSEAPGFIPFLRGVPACAGNAYPSGAPGFIPFLSGVPSCAGNAYPSGAPGFIPFLGWVHVAPYFSLLLSVLSTIICFFLFLPLNCLSFELRLLTTELLSSNISNEWILTIHVN